MCASCEWIFSSREEKTSESTEIPDEESDDGVDLSVNSSCPKCGFASFGARYVYGDQSYRYKFTQVPWLRKKMDRYESSLLEEIRKTNEFKSHRNTYRYLDYW